jgi:hypothetical protein
MSLIHCSKVLRGFMLRSCSNLLWDRFQLTARVAALIYIGSAAVVIA